MTTTTKNNTSATHEHIDQLARKVAAGTLKKIYTSTGNDQIRKLRSQLQSDFSMLDNAQYNTTANVIGQTVSDAYDVYLVAYEYLYEKITIKGLAAESEITITLKNGKEKTRTIYQWACVKVRKYIYSNKSIENNGQYIYIEDLSKNTNESSMEALDREYVRMGKYDGIQTYSDYETYTEILNKLELTERQRQLVSLRMRGISVTDIAEKIEVTKGAISKQLTAVQNEISKTYPELIRAFSLNKWTR